MIEKLLDKYYTAKLINEIKRRLLAYNLDLKFEYKDKCVSLFIKHRKYKDEEFKLIEDIYFHQSFMYICELKEFIKYLKSSVEKYLEIYKI